MNEHKKAAETSFEMTVIVQMRAHTCDSASFEFQSKYLVELVRSFVSALCKHTFCAGAVRVSGLRRRTGD